MQILADGILLDGTEGRPKYTLESVSGLLSSPGVKGDQRTRPSAHGDFDMRRFRGARLVRARGLVHSDSAYGQERDIGALSSVFAEGRSGPVTVQTASGGFTFTAGVADEPEIEVLVPGRVARYQLVLRAPNPRLYGGRRSASGASVTVHQYGNFPAHPVIEVAGPRSAPYTITGPGGEVITVTQTLTSSQTHRIDLATGALYRNGARQLGGMTHYKSWTVPPGGQVSAEISSGSMTVHVTDTYISIS